MKFSKTLNFYKKQARDKFFFITLVNFGVEECYLSSEPFPKFTAAFRVAFFWHSASNAPSLRTNKRPSFYGHL